ncbi:MAG: outer membrane beta-barrel protein [Tannerellaceae bacterium]|nr:outer membrane beta-barrel protein [Tannerellaceae bacterium]
MPEKKEPKESSDRFSEYMRQRLENYSMPLDDGCWKEIDARRKRATRLRRLSMAAAVLSAAVVAALLWLNAPAPRDSSPVVADVAPEYVTPEGPVTERPAAPVMKDEAGTSLVADASASKPVEPSSEGAPVEPEPPVEDTTAGPPPAEDTPGPPAEDVPAGPEPAEDAAPVGPGLKPGSGGRYDASPMQPEMAVFATGTGKKDKWLVSALFESGGSFSLAPGDYYVYDNVQNDMSSGSPLRVGEIVPPEYTHVVPDYTDKTCLPPLSFGFLLRRELGGRMAVESGLVYTYLATKFNRSPVPRSEAQLNLHYLGIPVNLVAYLHNSARWDVYASGGIMVEKGVRSFYEQRQYAGDKVIASTINTSIDGLQWSLNASIGVSYHIHKAWSIYLEPRLSYYFDSGQPVSIRTEHPTTIGLGAGVRYGF